MTRIEANRTRIVVFAIGLALITLTYGLRTREAAAQPTDSARGSAEARILDAGVIAKLEKGLGGASGGVWFEPSTLKLHVGVISAAGRKQAEDIAAESGVAEDVVPTSVRFTMKQLERAQDAWNRRVHDLFAQGEVSTGLAPDLNSVQIFVSSAVPPSRLADLRLTAAATEVPASIVIQAPSEFRVLPAAKCAAFVKFTSANCGPSITSGVRIEDASGSCSAGPLLIRKERSTTQKATETFVLTAGHCFHETGVGVIWSAFTTEGVQRELGKAIEELMPNLLEPEIDAGVIKVENNFWKNAGDPPVDPHRAAWEAGKETEPALVAKGENPALNMKICISGQRSGIQCGEVKALNQQVSIEYTEGEEYETEELVKVEFENKAGGGDSGGPVFAKEAPETILGHYVAYQDEEEKEEGKIGWFEPLNVSLARLPTEYELLTKTNKVRHKGGFKSEKEHVVLTTSSNAMQKFAVAEGGTAIECTTMKIEKGTVQSEATSVESIEFIPQYSNCETFLGAAVSIKTNECKYVPRLETGKTTGTIGISCPKEKAIEIVVGSICKYTIGSQSGLSSMSYKTVGAGSTREITVEPSVKGITVTRTTNDFFCPAGGSTGTYTGTSTITGENTGGSHVGVYVE